MSGDPDAAPFEQLVFSGGGTRCFWHGGFLEVTGPALGLAPDTLARVSGVSGGALSGAAWLGGRGRALLEIMGDRFADLDGNVRTGADAPGDGLTPHQQVYREVVEETLNEEACARVADGPAFQVLIAHPPSRRLGAASTLPMLLAYKLDLALRSSPDLAWPELAGLERELVDARAAARDGRLVDLVCNAAVIPPVFRLQGWNGRDVVDGGLACKAPMPDPDEGRTLVLLTRRLRNLPELDRRVYAEVSEGTPADKLDFTDREKIERTWALGRRDAERFLERLGAGARRGDASNDASSAAPKEEETGD